MSGGKCKCATCPDDRVFCFRCEPQRYTYCNLCQSGNPILKGGTGLCDPCWELNRRVRERPDLAEKVLERVEVKLAAERPEREPPRFGREFLIDALNKALDFARNLDKSPCAAGALEDQLEFLLDALEYDRVDCGRGAPGRRKP